MFRKLTLTQAICPFFCLLEMYLLWIGKMKVSIEMLILFNKLTNFTIYYQSGMQMCHRNIGYLRGTEGYKKWKEERWKVHFPHLSMFPRTNQFLHNPHQTPNKNLVQDNWKENKREYMCFLV
jgi:hypothetical protein